MKHTVILFTAVVAAGVTFILLNFPRFGANSETPVNRVRKAVLKPKENSCAPQPTNGKSYERYETHACDGHKRVLFESKTAKKVSVRSYETDMKPV